MTKHWEIKKIGEVCEVIAGQSPEGKYYNNSGDGLPFYQGKKEFTEKYLGSPTTWTTNITKEAQEGDILMSVRAPVGPVNFATGNICIGRGLAAIRTSKYIDREFLFNFLIKHESEIIGNSGAVFNSINKKQIENIVIPVPPISEQKKIVTILSEAFIALTKATENAERNLQNAREFFESYLQSIFANPGKDWKTLSLGEVCKEIFAGGDVPKNSSSRTKTDKYKIPIFANGATNKGLYGYTDQARVFEPSITVSARGTIGYSEIRYEPYFPVVRLIVLIPNQEVVTLPFLKYVVGTINFKNSGTSIPQLTVPMIKEYKFCLPQIVDQNRIVAKLDCLSVEINKLEAIYRQKLTDLEELKKSVLHKAFNGELVGACS